MALSWQKNYLRYKPFFNNIYRVYQTRTDIKMYLEILLSLTTIAIFAMFALRPTALTVTQLLEEIKTKEEVEAKMDKKIADLSVAQNIFRKESERIKLLNQALPDIPTPESFTRQIEGLSSKDNVELKNIAIGDVVLVGEVKKTAADAEFAPLPQGAQGISFSLSATGGYQELENFLKDLENLRRPLKVDYGIISVTQSDQNKVLSLSIRGRAPYFVKK